MRKLFPAAPRNLSLQFFGRFDSLFFLSISLTQPLDFKPFQKGDFF